MDHRHPILAALYARLWRASLKWRSQTGFVSWERWARYVTRWLRCASAIPTPTSACVRHPRQEPDAVVPHVRICGGGDQ